jgi:DNA modification methylase
VVIDVDKTKEKALNIALNKIQGEWNQELLTELIAELQSLDYDLAFTGFEPPEIDALFNAVHQSDDGFDVEAALTDTAISQLGDVWLLGKHRLVVGDSTRAETYDLLLEGKKADLVVTDPPYNVNYSAAAGTIKNDHQSAEAYYQFLHDAFSHMATFLSDKGSVYVFHADTEGLNVRRSFQEAGFHLSGVCVWAKQSLVLGRSPYQWQHEPVLFGWKKRGKHAWYSDRKQSTIWHFDRPAKNSDHPTMKPIPLLAYPIQNSSPKQGLVLDPFGGSGSTLMACEGTGRIGYLIELDERYADVIVKRYHRQYSNTNTIQLIRGGKTYAYSEVMTADEPHHLF